LTRFFGVDHHGMTTAYAPDGRRSRRSGNTTGRPEDRQADTSSASPAEQTINPEPPAVNRRHNQPRAISPSADLLAGAERLRDDPAIARA
jgi:hypothetical protein